MRLRGGKISGLSAVLLVFLSPSGGPDRCPASRHLTGHRTIPPPALPRIEILAVSSDAESIAEIFEAIAVEPME